MNPYEEQLQNFERAVQEMEEISERIEKQYQDYEENIRAKEVLSNLK